MWRQSRWIHRLVELHHHGRVDGHVRIFVLRAGLQDRGHNRICRCPACEAALEHRRRLTAGHVFYDHGIAGTRRQARRRRKGQRKSIVGKRDGSRHIGSSLQQRERSRNNRGLPHRLRETNHDTAVDGNIRACVDRLHLNNRRQRRRHCNVC